MYYVLAYCRYIVIPAITDRYSDGLVGVVHSAACGSNKFTGTRMHVLCRAPITCEADIRTARIRASNSNCSMGMVLCKPVNGRILCIHTHTKQGCGFYALADSKVQFKNWVWLMKTYVGIVARPYRIFLNFASHVIQSGSDPDNFLTRMTGTKHDPIRFQC